MNDHLLYGSLEDFVNETRAKGRFSFSREEVVSVFSLSGKALDQALYRMKSKNRIAGIRKGFYVIITPEYSKQGIIPPYLFIDDLMTGLQKRYYVGLFSAAALHGAGHQQPMEYYVITEKPALRSIKNQKIRLNFFVRNSWSETNIIQKKTDAGYINISTPELTALDLLTYGDFGISRILPVLEELAEEMKPSDLLRTARNYPVTSTLQRLGFLTDKKIGNEKLAQVLKRAIKERKIQPILLLKDSAKYGDPDTDWKVYINTKTESDL